jgi:hypothetical protein
MRIRAQHAVCETADSLRQRVGPAEHGKAVRHRRIEEHGSAHCQQESRSVSAALTRRGSQVSRCAVPDAYTFAAGAHGLSRLRLRRPRHDGLDQCASMFAPCLLGCPGTPRQHPVSAAPCGYRATAQNGSSRHVLALFDISSKRRIECRSGLLIRGCNDTGHRPLSRLSTFRLRSGPPSSHGTPLARPSVAVRGNADGAHRPPQLCTPTVLIARTPSAMRPWTAQHDGLQRDKVTHGGTETKRPASARYRS